MYISRKLKKIFHLSRTHFPALLITGPRQSGKTTFVQNELPDVAYETFDDPLNRDFARQDPIGFLNKHGDHSVILDEIQYVPEILSYIKMRIDRDRRPGKWIMTGSQQFHLMKNVSETLAGRIAILELPPFNMAEAESDHRTHLSSVIWNGLFPEPFLYPAKRDLWIKSYLQTYLERDVRQLESIRDFRAFEIFVQMSAAHHAQEFHPATLARDCGVTQPTIKSWAKTLETSYLAIMLPPFFNNFGKRLIKASKFYFIDPSLVSYLTRQPAAEAAISGNMGGALFEGLVVGEAWKSFTNLGKKPSIYYWRAKGGREIDLVVQVKGKLTPVEIKLTATPSAGHTRSLNYFKNLARSEASKTGILACRVEKKTELPGNNIAIPWRELTDLIH
ncbi:MAG: ATP-binding protein [Thermodesulfobacteriota bacterium]